MGTIVDLRPSRPATSETSPGSTLVVATTMSVGGDALRGVTRTTPQTNVFGVTTENKLVRINLADPQMVTVVTGPMAMPPPISSRASPRTSSSSASMSSPGPVRSRIPRA